MDLWWGEETASGTRIRKRTHPILAGDSFVRICERIRGQLDAELRPVREGARARRAQLVRTTTANREFFDQVSEVETVEEEVSDPVLAAMDRGQRQRFELHCLPSAELDEIIDRVYLDRFGPGFQRWPVARGWRDRTIDAPTWERWERWKASHPDVMTYDGDHVPDDHPPVYATLRFGPVPFVRLTASWRPEPSNLVEVYRFYPLLEPATTLARVEVV